jgi:hypothetical protein
MNLLPIKYSLIFLFSIKKLINYFFSIKIIFKVKKFTLNIIVIKEVKFFK